ncbi:hypothetical protein A4A49_39972 [Nicotiana attenuata]|uniref:Uncharacterized protein n=1 Tax=Nicotiana attenuata TaxID=49451 RepID=A0A1J6I127_NICAT|nr:hypothetical protein A4A49_39972 [Nicotiana attenuata]
MADSFCLKIERLAPSFSTVSSPDLVTGRCLLLVPFTPSYSSFLSGYRSKKREDQTPPFTKNQPPTNNHYTTGKRPPKSPSSTLATQHLSIAL